MAESEDRGSDNPEKSCGYPETSSALRLHQEACLIPVNNPLAEENELLRQIIQDKTTIINLLQEKLAILEEKLNTITIDNQEKSNGSINKSVHNHNGKAQHPPPTQLQEQPQQLLQSQPLQLQLSLPLPALQSPMPNNISNKELNIKSANKEGTNMDAFNDSSPKREINAGLLLSTESSRVVSNDVVNTNALLECVPQTVVLPTLETDNVLSEIRKDSNKNGPTNKSEPVNAEGSTATSTVKPIIPFDMTKIIRDDRGIEPTFPNDKIALTRDDVDSETSMENKIHNIKPKLPYKPGQWAPDRLDGKRMYERDFLLALKNFPASLQKPDNIPDSIFQDEGNRQIDGRLAMGGKSETGTLPKRNTPSRFVKGENTSEDDQKTEVLYRKVRAVLNKLTPQKFETLVNQVRQLEIDNKERLQGVVDLIFEKAIYEPRFSLAYAMMCKEIENMQVSVGDEKKHLAFRTLLVTRCQIEFEQQSLDDTERNGKLEEIKECQDPEKKKEFLFDLEEYDRRIRSRSIGIIRFLGELFKQHMLTASIIRRCLQTFLENKHEDSLECLCKLLTMVGKELESKNINLSSIFEEMNLITEENPQKVSSRIRFMLRDVIDLRDSKWVPRRDAQIQKEAETEHLNIQVNMNNPPRKDDRGGPRGGGGPRQKVSDDGWSSVSTRNNRQPFSIQTVKMRAAKLPLADEPLGSSQLFGNWGKGGGGVKKQKSSVETTSSSMYAALENIDMERRPLNSRGDKEPFSSKGFRHSGIPMQNTGLPTSLMLAYQPIVQPAPKPPSVPKLSEEQIQRRIRNSLDEFITGCCTTTEYFQDISSTLPPSDYNKVVKESYSHILEKSQTARLKTGELFAKLIKSNCISIEDFCKGFEELLGLWEDLVIDMPQIWQYFAEDLIFLLLEEVLPFPRLKVLLDSLIEVNMSKKLLKPLFSLVVKEKGPNFLHNSWKNSGLQLSAFMPASDVQSFVQDSNLGFLLCGDSPVGQSPLSHEDIENKLSELFHSGAIFHDVVNWISANVGNRVTENKFIRTLATAIFKNSISSNKLQVEVLTCHTKLIQKYVGNNSDYELQSLYALQSLVHKLEHPQGLLLSICDKLYEDSTFCRESFIAWESSTDPAEQEGKDVASKQLIPFFIQLKENEEDEDYSSNSEDA